ncbi:hypothetical protein GTY65_24420 [Streptomyces sp. SID8379]|uniref:hypothetical protein n=1 Tax=unclassified Streptomyces TaxID=2593676 RepID=UPI0003692B16|nr:MULTISPECIES: hypothetical protein [unclassified Streptomyces]MYW67188.1 hypothetical protein [Streptomyces sp. SID8379]
MPTLTITVPNHAKLRADAEKSVTEELGKIARPDDRFKRACEIVQQADLEIAAHQDERNQAALSLWFYDDVRGLNKIMGITPNAYSEMRRIALRGDRKATINHGGSMQGRLTAEERAAAAKEAGVPHVEDAAETLSENSQIVSVATARRSAAMPFLQDAALALTEAPYEMTTNELAELGNVTPKYARDVKNDAKRRRQR